MINRSTAVSRTTPKTAAAPEGRRKRLVVFSPDADLSRFLILNLEDRFEIARVHALSEFEQSMDGPAPDLVLVDLYTFAADVGRQLDVVRRHAVAVPVIVLRAYVSLSPETDRAIEEMADHVFYKPVDVELITQAIEDTLK
jgi:DNA-binding NtrC family response regulator